MIRGEAVHLFFLCTKNAAGVRRRRQDLSHVVLPGVQAVSYTHLDVYKRQLPPQGSALPSAPHPDDLSSIAHGAVFCKCFFAFFEKIAKFWGMRRSLLLPAAAGGLPELLERLGVLDGAHPGEGPEEPLLLEGVLLEKGMDPLVVEPDVYKRQR